MKFLAIYFNLIFLFFLFDLSKSVPVNRDDFICCCYTTKVAYPSTGAIHQCKQESNGWWARFLRFFNPWSCTNVLETKFIGNQVNELFINDCYLDLALFNNPVVNLNSLIAPYSKVVNIESQTRTTRSIRELVLRDNKLTEIPILKDIIPLQKCDLSHNQIESIQNKSYFQEEYTNLAILYLNNNKINYIHKNAFKKLRLLKEVHLQDNKLINIGFSFNFTLFGPHKSYDMSFIDDHSFYLDNNPIQSFSSLEISDITTAKRCYAFYFNTLFPQMPNHSIGKTCLRIQMKNYVYSRNESSNFETRVKNFSILEVNTNSAKYSKLYESLMQRLNLTSNNIISLPDLSRFKLISLNLNNNSLQRLEHPEYLSKDIEDLYFANNNISFIQEGFFKKFLKLKFLTLQNNNLKYLENFLVYSENLKYLNLENNKLSKLEYILFENENLVRNISISLSWNMLSKLPKVIGNLESIDTYSLNNQMGSLTRVESYFLDNTHFKGENYSRKVYIHKLELKENGLSSFSNDSMCLKDVKHSLIPRILDLSLNRFDINRLVCNIYYQVLFDQSVNLIMYPFLENNNCYIYQTFFHLVQMNKRKIMELCPMHNGTRKGLTGSFCKPLRDYSCGFSTHQEYYNFLIGNNTKKSLIQVLF